MDLPTYTNIWRIEKRLYKLYDLRLPTPLPIVWIGVFVGVLVPWSFLLWLVGVPPETPWHVVYLVPPGIVTWLSTRPVIESKRLTELMQSQLRYLSEPRAWTRMASATEPETVTFSGRVWRVLPVRVKAPKKARHSQRKRATAPVSPARAVRPAVAAAAAAATHAPVAGAPPTRWGAAAPSRRSAAAPALGTAAAVSPVRPAADPTTSPPPADRARTRPQTPTPVSAVPAPESPPTHEPARAQPVSAQDLARAQNLSADPVSAREPARVQEPGSAPEPVRAAEPPRARESARAQEPGIARELARAQEPVSAREPVRAAEPPRAPEPVRAVEPVRAPEPERGAEPVVGSTVAEGRPAAGHDAAVPDVAAAAVQESGRSVAAGKPIDAEALRRLRRLAATADAQPAEGATATAAGSALPATEPPTPPHDDARLQHRKGQPPRPGAPLSLPSSQRVWPPSATATPAKDAPAKDIPVKNAPVTGAPATDVPVKRAPVAGAPVKDVPVKKAPVAGAPAKDAPVKDVPVTGAPVMDVPAMEPVRDDAVEESVPREAAARAELPGKGVQGRPFSEVRVEPEVGTAAHRAGTPAVPEERVPGPRVRRVESVVGRDSGGWRRIAQVVVGGGGPRTDGSEIDEARARAVFSGSRRVVVLGCTGGAGQTTTALMLGHTLAKIRDDRVVAVDANTGGNTLTSRVQAESPETLTSLLAGLDQVSGYLTMRGYTSRTSSGLEVIGADTDAGAEQRLADRTLFSDHRLGQAVHLLDRHYKLAVIDPAAALAARVLPYADQLVLVVPASEEAPEAVAMTFEWLDGHGCADLRRRAVIVVNGVSRRSMADVEQAEAVARGRCRAIVRVPWEDELAPSGTVVEPGQLRAAGRRAYLALAGVVVAGFAAQMVRASEEELASDPPGTRIGER